MRASILPLAAALSTAAAVSQGFNYGSTNPDGTFATQSNFENSFNTAKNLVGTSGFTSARLYTTIQGGSSTNQPIEAIPAAIASGTTLLLGFWASGGQDGINAEIAALKAAVAQYGKSFTDLVVGLSVGSEDLYRISETGIEAKSGVGADPATLVSYITQVRAAVSSLAGLSSVSIGHVDTWTAWVNGSNDAVINAVDWIGMDAYPYFQNTQANSISNGQSLFNDALSATQAAVGGKTVWITETGWPVSGSVSAQASPSLANAKTYWDEVGCPNFGKVNTYWYTLQDSSPSSTPNPSFGIVGGTLSTTPLFDLSCSAVASSSSSAASSLSTDAVARSSISSSIASSVAVGASSVASLATASGSALATSGSGLTPSIGAGNGISISSETVVASTTASGASTPASSVVPVVVGGSNGSSSGSGSSGSSGSGSTGSGSSGSGSSNSSGSSGTGSSGSGSSNSSGSSGTGSSGSGTSNSTGSSGASGSGSSGSGSSSNGSYIPGSSAIPSTTGGITAETGAASSLSGSLMGAAGALIALLAL